jgi:hypothetical protein
MKKFLVAGLLLGSINVFSQSYLVLSNGITLTTDKAGFIYDFANFRLPYKVLSKGNGGQFLIADEKLSTVDASGFMYERPIDVKAVRGYGLNYFITDDNYLYTIDSKGYSYEFKKEANIFKKAQGFGGRYILVKPEDRKPLVELYTVNANGNFAKLDVAGLNPAEINHIGGSFFRVKSGLIYTISKEGYVFPKPDMKVGDIKLGGGNFLINSENLLYTISEDGLLITPVLPLNLKVAEIKKAGANYMLDGEGRIFLVTASGEVVERTINHDLRETKILSSF